ncbi:MAG: hypothetical protein IJO76_05135 [Clostridia bacterium]|nr:hypothetical protein [Clostridia bacterium]
MELLAEIIRTVDPLLIEISKPDLLNLMDCPFEKLSISNFDCIERLLCAALDENILLEQMFCKLGITKKQTMIYVMLSALYLHSKSRFWQFS